MRKPLSTMVAIAGIVIIGASIVGGIAFAADRDGKAPGTDGTAVTVGNESEDGGTPTAGASGSPAGSDDSRSSSHRGDEPSVSGSPMPSASCDADDTVRPSADPQDSDDHPEACDDEEADD